MKDLILKQYGKWIAADLQTPISIFLRLVGCKPGILLESAEVDGRLGRYSLIAWDYRLRLLCSDGKLDVHSSDQRFDVLQEYSGMSFLDGLRKVMKKIRIEPEKGFEKLPPLTRGLCGYFGYGMGGLFEPRLAKALPPENAEACLVLPGKVVLFDHLYMRCCHLSLDECGKPELDGPIPPSVNLMPGIGIPRNIPEKDEYMQGVRTIKELIRNGEGIQVVLSTRFEAPFSGEPFAIYRRLRQLNPSPYMFFLRFPRMTLMGSSPELMVRCENGHLEVRPIAGTRPRGKNEGEDLLYAEDLIKDPKERAEHVMLVDLGRNDLGRIAQPGSVIVDRFMEIERFSHVMHMTSYVGANLKHGLDAIDVLASTFPAGTVSGAPKIWAMETIAGLEPLPRGPYAGAIGWIGLDEGRVDLDTGITIRSTWIRDGMIHWQAGAGIVYDSDPEKEWQECRNKAKVLGLAMKGREGENVFAN